MPDSTHYARIGQIGGLVTSSRIDTSERGRKGQQGLFAKFYRETAPELPEDERHRRAEAALKAHFARMRQKQIAGKAQ